MKPVLRREASRCRGAIRSLRGAASLKLAFRLHAIDDLESIRSLRGAASLKQALAPRRLLAVEPPIRSLRGAASLKPLGVTLARSDELLHPLPQGSGLIEASMCSTRSSGKRRIHPLPQGSGLIEARGSRSVVRRGTHPLPQGSGLIEASPQDGQLHGLPHGHPLPQGSGLIEAASSRRAHAQAADPSAPSGERPH